MLADKQATSHSPKCENVKMRSRSIDYKMNGGLSIKVGHTAIVRSLPVRHVLKCSTAPTGVMSGAKITNVSVGFLRVILTLFHHHLYQWWSIFPPPLVQGEMTRRTVSELFIKTLCNAHSSASDEFWSSENPWRIRGENGFVFNLVHRLFIYSIWSNAVPASEPRRHLHGQDFPWLLSADCWGEPNGWRSLLWPLPLTSKSSLV